MICYTCNEAVKGPVCVGCTALQPPPFSLDPFVLLGVPRRYHLAAAQVDEAYRTVARRVHPDKFAARPAVERRMSLQWTAALNEARRVLKDPDRRARMLATGQAEPREKGGPKLDPTFLAEIFEWREQDEETPGALSELAREREAELRVELDTIFVAWEQGTGDLTLVEDRLARLKYVTGLIREPSAPGS
ncbi:MAG: iron-sulfur cluster co-chaperone HscB C-terminal domain-containing protein [Pseudomonadota bacterium]|nr:iron-sulfur cluster co-chaperone HscB C-terminal domain-containing protein [Pseudomonadota bacterium]